MRELRPKEKRSARRNDRECKPTRRPRFRQQIAASGPDAGLPIAVTAHMFRWSCATELVRDGDNPWQVKDQVGHENLKLSSTTPAGSSWTSSRPMPGAIRAHGGVENYHPLPMVRAMSLTLEQIVEEAQQWPDDVVADLVDRLMLARHGVSDPTLNPAWRATVDRRVEEIRSGKEKGIPGEVVSARIRKIVGR